MYNLSILLFAMCSILFSGTITGNVKIQLSEKGLKKKLNRTEIRAVKNEAVCGKIYKEHKLLEEKFIIDKDANFKNVLVWLQGADYQGDPIEKPAFLEQQGCVYSPHVQGVMVGQKVLIKNSGGEQHNVNCKAKENHAFNFSMPAQLKEKDVVFTKPEEMIAMVCNVHGWMKSWITVFDHPYFSVTDDKGNYIIENVPNGKYKLIALHEYDETNDGFRIEKEIVIEDGKDTAMNFNIKPGPKRK